jgi:hypothetical protein
MNTGHAMRYILPLDIHRVLVLVNDQNAKERQAPMLRKATVANELPEQFGRRPVVVAARDVSPRVRLFDL